MEAPPPTLPQLRAELIRLGFERLEVGQLLAKVPQGPGYYDAVQPLLARQQAAEAAHKTTQLEITRRLQGAQPTLF